MSWKPASVNAQPVWQAAQLALPLHKAKPRLAVALMAFSSPLSQRSNGASVDTIERWKVAKACSKQSRVTPPWPNALSKAVTQPGAQRALRQMHISLAGDRPHSDAFQIAEVPIPAQFRYPGDVEQRRAAQWEPHLIFPDRARLAIAPGQTGIMAGSARAYARARQDRVKEQCPAELFFR